MKKTIHKTIIKIEILSDEPINDSLSLNDIDYECTEGEWSMSMSTVSSTPIKGKAAVKAIESQGSDPEFFMMDENGNKID